MTYADTRSGFVSAAAGTGWARAMTCFALAACAHFALFRMSVGAQSGRAHDSGSAGGLDSSFEVTLEPTWRSDPEAARPPSHPEPPDVLGGPARVSAPTALRVRLAPAAPRPVRESFLERTAALGSTSVPSSTPSERGVTCEDCLATAAPSNPAAGVVSRPPGMLLASAGRPASSARLRSHGPRLTTPEACRRYFPREAREDSGTVLVSLRVTEAGIVSQPEVLAELPPSQGFGRAALGCAGLLKFEPAASVFGARIASVSVVKLRFARSRRD